ncbi:precorrin-3B C(17)-methyltransferase [Alphaproteobacteria bacterium LSUCC0684]
MSPVFVALTSGGAELAWRLALETGGVWHGLAGRTGTGHAPEEQFEDTVDHLRDLFLSGRPLVGVCAAGILIRALAGHVLDKRAESPVLAISEDGKVIIPLLGGHHGANTLAEKLAGITGGLAAITTAGDRAFGLALDEPPAPLVLADPDKAKPVMARLLAGEGARLETDLPPGLEHIDERWRAWLSPLPVDAGGDGPRLALTLKPAAGMEADLVFHPVVVTLGLGASRGCPEAEMAALVERGLKQASVAKAAIREVASVDLKADEAAMNVLATKFGHRLRLYSASRLEEEAPRLANPSEVVFNEIGCHGVAEAAALAAAGPDSRFLLPKIRDEHATMALVLDRSGEFRDETARHAGRVMLVGIGPGQSIWRSPEATSMVAAADELVGYHFYIDLLGPVARGKPRRDFALGEEEARCRYALEEAAKGRDIAIICSGDAGIYAMGALVYELLSRDEASKGVSAAARRVEVLTAPGVSALQAAAARSGAILGHDFCTISLSDLMTPWAQIETRIEAAGMGDFVIAFYNPVSRRRRAGLAKAKEILLKYRPASTPVVLASSLGRPEEEIRFRDLGGLEVDEVDMLTVVMVGASSSRIINHRGGKAVFTPRGYATHLDTKGDET